MYMSQHHFTPVPAKYELWAPYNRNYMSLTARAPGAVLSRILRRCDQPESFFAVGLWTDREMASRWTESAEAKLGAKPSQDLGLYDGYPMTWTRWGLADFAWGLQGPAGLTGPGLFVKHLTWEVSADGRSAGEAFRRALLSLLARRPGFVCGETYLSHRGDRVQGLYTLKDAGAWPLSGEAPPELRLVLQSHGAPGLDEATSLDCTLFETVWGPEQAALQRFIGAGAAA
jgi:hypothetical protein